MLRWCWRKNQDSALLIVDLDFYPKCLTIEDLDIMEVEIAITLCKLEAVFPPAFFAPIQYRWKYPIDRYLRTLKSRVRNKAQPEGYLAEECVTFCSKEIQAMMDDKLQDERKKILVELKRNVEEELQRKLDKEREHVEVDENPGRSEQKIQEKLAAFMSKM